MTEALQKKLHGYSLTLGSGSPRRKELLAGLHLPFTVRTLKTEEDFPDTLPALQVAPYLAEKKAQAFRDTVAAKEIILTADTVVIAENNILNKPAEASEASEMLHLLSGKTHTVCTGFSLLFEGQLYTQADEVKVDMLPLSAEAIAYYIETARPYDKAGAYGIQEWIGHIGVKAIHGSFYTVMGLPVHLVYSALLQLLSR
ncbi:maf protein [Nitritalea halalkaliphila LW7]|uniref:dTTP/UTP pyrophosphatase n=1 Tax=Nitritalea halalkaliphila LW7 TaxID=1189621 RepID=I5C3M1_9BACT|nr:Maf family nucleotide pyrophosphatase [Nitritalea halalkaliphila]EIM76423.1 maf protein [Nitritalea halalkaliphila LW7]